MSIIRWRQPRDGMHNALHTVRVRFLLSHSRAPRRAAPRRVVIYGMRGTMQTASVEIWDTLLGTSWISATVIYTYSECACSSSSSGLVQIVDKVCSSVLLV